MKKIGLIAEYNPIHLGHIYQIKKIKDIYPDSLIILITSNNFTQRGEINILNKWDKTKICLNNSIDLIIELPTAFATQSADIFASSALYILNKLKIDTLIFGSESNDLNKIKKIVNTQLKNKNYNKLVKAYMKDGLNYPTAMSKALTTLLGYTIKEPNDLLAISYVKEIVRNNYKINPVSIKRTNNYKSKIITSKIIPATLIRTLIKEKKDISPYIPQNTSNCIYKDLTNESYYPYLKYKIITSKDLSIYKTVNEGIENRIKKVITKSNTWQELIENIKTKRYTYNKINRTLIHILLSLTKEEEKKFKINYIRILGFNNKGRKHINQLKKELKQQNIKIITNYKPNISPLLDFELKATKIYELPLKDNLSILELKNKPIIKK